MNKIQLLFLPVLLLVGCENEMSPLKTDLYPQKVYIVGVRDQIIDRNIDIGKLTDTIHVSVAISGSRLLSKDVNAVVKENPDEIALYNQRNVSGEDIQYQKLNDTVYSYPLNQITIKAGQVYNTYPILIKPSTLQCDSLYMIPLRLQSISDYELSDIDTTVLVKLHLTNKYAGLYYVDGILKNRSNESDSTYYKMTRNLIATDNGNTVRMYHFNNETKEYLPSHTFKITINNDYSLSYSTWEDFIIYDGGGKYHPDIEVYDFWYEYDNNGTKWLAKGYLYKERKTSAEQEKLDDWLEEQKKTN